MSCFKRLIPVLLVLVFMFAACTPQNPPIIVNVSSAPTLMPDTEAPTTAVLTAVPTLLATPTALLTALPTVAITETPTEVPTPEPTEVPTTVPTEAPTQKPTPTPTVTLPTADPNDQRPQTGNKVIYLTFDDGPCSNTLRVLDILDQYGAKATFFTVGCFVDRYPEIARETVRRGQLIACHSYTHDFSKCYASAEAFMAEVHQWETAVQNAVGQVPERVCVRFPGGSNCPAAKPVSQKIKQLLEANGYHWYDWNSGNNDKWLAGNTNNLPIEEYLMQSYQQTLGWHEGKDDIIIFLMHDTVDATVRVLPRILQDLVARGYTFKTLDEHPDWR